MPNPTEFSGPHPSDHEHHKKYNYQSSMCSECRNVGQDSQDIDHEHHKSCVYHASRCETCPNLESLSPGELALRRITRATNTYGTPKRPTYRHTAKPPWVDFEKQRELVPSEESIFNYSSDDAPDSPGIRLKEKLVTCRITFDDREPERSDSGKAITIHQCEAHLVIVTWDES